MSFQPPSGPDPGNPQFGESAPGPPPAGPATGSFSLPPTPAHPPSQLVSTPPPPPVRFDASTPPPTQPLLLVGAVIVGVSIFLEWGSESFFGESFTASDIPLQLLWDTTPADFGNPSLMFALIAAVVGLVVGGVSKRLRPLAAVGAVLGILTALLYLNAVRSVLADPLYDIEGGITGSVGIGVWVCLIGSVASLVVAIVALRHER